MDLEKEEAVSVCVVGHYVIEAVFRDGTRRRIDIEPYLGRGVFEPLGDPALFAQVAIDPTFGTVCWPTGADLSPEFAYYGEAGPPPGYYGGDQAPAEDAGPALADRR